LIFIQQFLTLVFIKLFVNFLLQFIFRQNQE